MYLKDYQVKVVKALKDFFIAADKKRSDAQNVLRQFPDMKSSLDWVKTVFETINVDYKDHSKNGLNEPYPRVAIKVPTGGGKTLLAVETIREYQNLFAKKRTGLIVWIVPSETIYTQTIDKLRDKSNPLRQLLDQSSGGHTLIKEKGEKLKEQDLKDNLVILFVMIQSISRSKGKEALRVFQDSGGYEDFFPLDNRYDLHKQLIEQVPNLDKFSEEDNAMFQIKTSLGNAIRLTNPLIIIDEIHKVFSEQARKTIDNLNPSMVVGFSATPKKLEMNIIVSVTGLELKHEDMVKLDLHILAPKNQTAGYKGMLSEIKSKRDELEKKAKKLKDENGTYIRPIALIQVERTGKEQRTGRFVHSLDVKEELIRIGINESEIAIKTSSQNDIEDVDLLSRNTEIRYIITKEALREGWDCSFAYVLGIIPNVNSNTGVTQLVGRILRQPYAQKTGVKELDESYVYYVNGDTRNILKNIVEGFKKEGLEDLTKSVSSSANTKESQTKDVKIKKEFKKYDYSFYLPVWLIINDKTRRRFSYDADIKSNINFENFKLSKKDTEKIISALSKESSERKVINVTIDDESKTISYDERENIENFDEVNLGYVTRRFSEVIENPFLARITANNCIKQFESKDLKEHFGFIVSELVKILETEKDKQEKEIFKSLLKSKKLTLAVSNDEKNGYIVPRSDSMTINQIPSTYHNYLYDDVDLQGMNSLEKQVGDILDSQDKILWWFRNKQYKGWYAIQGWKKNKIRPDFVAAKRNDNGKLELVYVLEAKGEMLLGNADTEYKNEFLTDMNDETVEKYMQTKLEFDTANDKFEFYLIPQGDEELKIKGLMK